MLGRKTFTPDEIDHGKSAVAEQLDEYRRLAGAVEADAKDKTCASALESFERVFFNNMILALDRLYVHRVRAVSGKDGNPLNEVELICDSLMSNQGVMQGNNVIKYVPEQSVIGLAVGDRIRLTVDEFDRLSAAFFVELERRFLE